MRTGFIEKHHYQSINYPDNPRKMHRPPRYLMSPDQQRMLRATLDAGMREHAQGRVEAAREAYQRALAAAPDHPEAWFLMGTALLQLGQAQEAAAGLERAARTLRNHPGVLGNLAQAYFLLGRFDDATGLSAGR